MLFIFEVVCIRCCSYSVLLMLNAVDVHFHVDFVNVVAVLIISINKLNERIRLI